ncbi:hypothetical protein GCM10009426_29510 [Rheinheimera tangshanensis]|nr:hypothetical protein GCM10010920_32320 [Rheinheimera tangshanensis]
MAGQDGPLSPDPEPQDGVSTVVHRQADKTTRCHLIAQSTVVHRQTTHFRLTQNHKFRIYLAH